jgi:WD40 repeat protein
MPAFSPDGHTLAVATWNLVRLWDIAGHRQIRKPLTGHASVVTTVTFSPNGRMLASGLSDGSVQLWTIDADSG